MKLNNVFKNIFWPTQCATITEEHAHNINVSKPYIIIHVYNIYIWHIQAKF